jgi:rhamnosyltransferase
MYEPVNKKILISICNPLFNAEEWLDQWFESILDQEHNYEIEFILIDSGSSDRTVEIIYEWRDKISNKVELLEIPNSNYGHGKTRNEFPKLANGEFLVYTVQDSIPLNNNWLKNLIEGFALDSKIMAISSRHVATDKANCVTKRLITKTFDDYLRALKVLNSYKSDGDFHYYLDGSEITDWSRYSDFSNVSAAYRRSIFDELEFRDLNFAEDRSFLKDVIEIGYTVGFANDSIIVHSHDYTYLETMRRQYDEWRALKAVGHYPYKFRFYHIFTQAFFGYLRDLQFIVKSDQLSFSQRITSIFTAIIMELMIRSGMYFGLNDDRWTEKWKERLSQQSNWRKNKSK